MNGRMSRVKHYVEVVSSTDVEGHMVPLVVV